MNDLNFDDFNDFDYDWDDEIIGLEEQLNKETDFDKLSFDMNYKEFKYMNDTEKLTYLYNKIRDLYSFFLTNKDVVK